jgi:hypothetical protein
VGWLADLQGLKLCLQNGWLLLGWGTVVVLLQQVDDFIPLLGGRLSTHGRRLVGQEVGCCLPDV